MGETHDFAMAILEREITFTDSVRPICIPRQNMEFGGSKAIAAGWGRYKVAKRKTGKVERQSLSLRDVELAVSSKKYDHYKMFGTKGTNEKGKVTDACSGDSGGPLIWKSPAARFVLIGTVQGSGFDCRTGEFSRFEGSENGVWIKKAMKDENKDGHNSAEALEELEETANEEDGEVVAGEVETEEDYWRAMRNYKKELKKKVLEEVEKETEKIKRQKKAKDSKKDETSPKNITSGGKEKKESSKERK